MEQALTRRIGPRLGVGLRIGALAVAIAIPATLAATARRGYDQSIADAELRAVNTARVLQQHAERTIEVTDTYLQAIASLVNQRGIGLKAEVLHQSLREQFGRSRGLRNIVVIDRDGRSTVEAVAFPARALDVSDRDYFRALRDHPEGALSVGRPIIGNLTHTLVLPIARRINNPDGSFAGIVQAVLDPDAFQGVYDSIDNGRGAVLNLWRSDGTLLIRSPHNPGLVGRNFAATDNFRNHVVPRDRAAFWAPSATDGVERVIAIGYLEGYPLYVGAALARSEVLADWRRSTILQGCVGGFLTLVLATALLMLAKEVERRRSADARIRWSEARYRLLAENTTDVIIMCDLDTTRRYVSPAARVVFGHEPEALIGTQPLDFVHPDDVPAYRQTLADLTTARVSEAVTTQRYRHRSGEWVWIEVSFKLTRDPGSGVATGYVASLRDITARKSAEIAAAESEARYREVRDTAHTAILGQIAEGVIVTDAAGRITIVNEAARAIHGVAHLDVGPDTYSDTYHLFTEDGRAHPALDLPLARAVRGETVTDARWRVRRPDGVEVLAVGSARPLKARDGRQVGAVLTLRDDTAREAADHALRVLNATLAERVAERTHEAEAARALAEAGSQAKSEFLAAMSQEIRTPLNGVIGYADLLCEEPNLSAVARQHAERIRGAGSALLTVVNDVLDISKIEAGRVEIAARPFALAALIDDTVSIVRGLAEAKGLGLGVVLDPGLPAWLAGDADRLRQVLLNLLNNAVKFTGEGRIDLRIDATAVSATAARLTVGVSDTGIGVAADKRDRLFRRFSQVDGSISRDYGGTGLGLAISKGIVERMGGTIGVASEPGRGSTFWFTLDLPIADAPERTAEPSPSTGGSVGKRILLAEDVPLNQELACMILERAGHAVDVVGDGAAAVAAVQARDYDLVLMDVQMPGVDGPSATRQIRSLGGAGARVPIVALTANVLPNQVAAFRAAGMDDHVGKPFRQADLLATVRRWTTRDGAQDAGPTLDRAVFDDMAGLVGRERMVRLLAMLSEDLAQRFGPSAGPGDPARVAGDAHAMISAASMVGFSSLAELCRDVERACLSGQDHGPLLATLRSRAAATVVEIEALRAA